MLSPKVIVRDSRFGKGLFAGQQFTKDELVLRFDGPALHWHPGLPEWPEDLANHAVQCGAAEWVNPQDNARLINHSCEPNCGVRGLLTLVAMRDIVAGEELMFDYAMTENGPWRLKCACGNPNCRGIIRGYSGLSEEVRKKYAGYISEWLS